MARESREVWAKRIERWGETGLTAEEFADEVGVNVHTLRHWKWLLGNRPPVRRSLCPAPPFVEVVGPFVADPGDRAPDADRKLEAIELVLPSGVRIRVPSQFDASALRRMVDALEGR